ncbi:Myotubularin 1 [Pelomyxa schiedti]|nr:Myotubularin 1 [Pelomyxa schiedti]
MPMPVPVTATFCAGGRMKLTQRFVFYGVDCDLEILRGEQVIAAIPSKSPPPTPSVPLEPPRQQQIQIQMQLQMQNQNQNQSQQEQRQKHSLQQVQNQQQGTVQGDDVADVEAGQEQIGSCGAGNAPWVVASKPPRPLPSPPIIRASKSAPSSPTPTASPVSSDTSVSPALMLESTPNLAKSEPVSLESGVSSSPELSTNNRITQGSSQSALLLTNLVRISSTGKSSSFSRRPGPQTVSPRPLPNPPKLHSIPTPPQSSRETRSSHSKYSPHLQPVRDPDTQTSASRRPLPAPPLKYYPYGQNTRSSGYSHSALKTHSSPRPLPLPFPYAPVAFHPSAPFTISENSPSRMERAYSPQPIQYFHAHPPVPVSIRRCPSPSQPCLDLRLTASFPPIDGFSHTKYHPSEQPSHYYLERHHSSEKHGHHSPERHRHHSPERCIKSPETHHSHSPELRHDTGKTHHDHSPERHHQSRSRHHHSSERQESADTSLSPERHSKSPNHHHSDYSDSHSHHGHSGRYEPSSASPELDHPSRHHSFSPDCLSDSVHHSRKYDRSPSPHSRSHYVEPPYLSNIEPPHIDTSSVDASPSLQLYDILCALSKGKSSRSHVGGHSLHTGEVYEHSHDDKRTKSPLNVEPVVPPPLCEPFEKSGVQKYSTLGVNTTDQSLSSKSPTHPPIHTNSEPLGVPKQKPSLIIITNFRMYFISHVCGGVDTFGYQNTQSVPSHTIEPTDNIVNTKNSIITNCRNRWSDDNVKRDTFSTDISANSMAIPLACVEKAKWSSDQGQKICTILSKDLRKITLSFLPNDDAAEAFELILDRLSFSNKLTRTFAFVYQSYYPNTGWSVYNTLTEYTRLMLPDSDWRVSSLNHDFLLCPSYPQVLVVPAALDDSVFKQIPKYYSSCRFPILSWRHPVTRALLLRSAKPRIDFSGNTLNANFDLLSQLEKLSKRLAFVDCCPEVQPALDPVGLHDKTFSCNLLLDDLQELNKSYQNIGEIPSLPPADIPKWLLQLQSVLNSASRIADYLCAGTSVLTVCLDGSDRSTQLNTLATLIIDPYFRTLLGFEVLIEKEWLSFGHKFSLRVGHARKRSSSERSPVFLQFIDCVYQLTLQYPCAFEFNENFLLKIVDALFSCRYGTFLADCALQREALGLTNSTISLWSEVNYSKAQYVNPLYIQGEFTTITPSSNMSLFQLWKGHFQRNPKFLRLGDCGWRNNSIIEKNRLSRFFSSKELSQVFNHAIVANDSSYQEDDVSHLPFGFLHLQSGERVTVLDSSNSSWWLVCSERDPTNIIKGYMPSENLIPVSLDANKVTLSPAYMKRRQLQLQLGNSPPTLTWAAQKALHGMDKQPPKPAFRPPKKVVSPLPWFSETYHLACKESKLREKANPNTTTAVSDQSPMSSSPPSSCSLIFPKPTRPAPLPSITTEKN